MKKHNKPKIINRQLWRRGLCGLLAAALLAPAVPVVNAAEAPDSHPEETAQVVRVALPQDKGALAEALRQVGAQEGIDVQLIQAGTAAGFGASLEEMPKGSNAPDVFWLGSEADARTARGLGMLGDFSGEERLQPTRSLASIAPAGTRLLTGRVVYGLPVGYYASGYLVNIDTLAALLATEQKKQLAEDLTACSYEEWEALVHTVGSYLIRPRKSNVTLAGRRYSFAGYRPERAKALRGVFAVADASGEGLVGGALQAAAALPYTSETEYLSSLQGEKDAATAAALRPVFGLLALESLYMARSGGSIARGEGYLAESKLSESDAEELFVGGAALFLRGDSRTALRLEAEAPGLAGNVAMLPVKLPPNYQTQQEKEEENKPVFGQPPEEEEEEQQTPEESEDTGMQLPIEEGNATLRYAADGYLCLHAGAQNAGAAETLLLAFYTKGKNRALFSDALYLYSFADLYPASLLQQQLQQAANGDGRPTVAFPAITPGVSAVGRWVQQQLLPKEEWTAEDLSQFESYAVAALGQYTELAPDEEDASGEEWEA